MVLSPIRRRSTAGRRNSRSRLNDATSLDASAFADPSKTNGGYGVANEDTFPFFPQLNVGGPSVYSHWNYGTRSETLHLTSSISPTWQLDISASAKRSHFTETPLDNVNFIDDFTGIRQAASPRKAWSFAQSPLLHDYGFGIDTEKTVNFHGQHTLSAGWGYTHSIYQLNKYYSGGQSPFPSDQYFRRRYHHHYQQPGTRRRRDQLRV